MAHRHSDPERRRPVQKNGVIPSHPFLPDNGGVLNAIQRDSGAALLFMLLTAGGAAGQVPVREISIRSAWGGLGPPRNELTTIRAMKGVLTSGGKRVEQSRVEALIAALKAVPVSKPDAAMLGVTPGWLNARMGDKNGRFQRESARATASQRALLARTFSDPEKIAPVLPALFSYVSFDDNPSASIDVTFADGSHLTAETHSYYAFMLPWTVGGQGQRT